MEFWFFVRKSQIQSAPVLIWKSQNINSIYFSICRFMALQSEMAATLQHHHTNGVLVSSAASPTPSIDSLTGMVVASNGTNAGLNGDSGHEHSESGLASAGSGGLNTGANTDRVSSSSASSSGLGSSPLGNGSLFSSNATKCAICSGTFQRPKVWNESVKIPNFNF